MEREAIDTGGVGEQATSMQTSNGSSPNSDWDQGYGYQFWRSRHNSFRGDGAFGQYCMVIPEQDAVVAITSGVRDMQKVMNLVWDKLLPAMKSGRLPENRIRSTGNSKHGSAGSQLSLRRVRRRLRLLRACPASGLSFRRMIAELRRCLSILAGVA